MRFAFTDDQLAFATAVRELLAAECTAADVRACWENETGHSPQRWRRLAEMGVVGMTVPEARGGLGLSLLDLVLVLEETGRAGLPEPIVDTTAVVAPLLADFADERLVEEWLAPIAAGEAIAVVQHQSRPYVANAGYADLLVLNSGNELHAVHPSSVRLIPQTSVDGARRMAEIEWRRTDATRIVGGADGFRAINAAFDRGALGTAAQLLGLAARMLDLTVAYADEREQFGVPIGSFQAVKHRLADAALALEFARPVVYRAAYSVATGAAQQSRDVSMGKAYASRAARTVADAALQVHGAIGYTVEYDLHLFMKRAWALAASWGDAAWHRQRVAVSVLGPAPTRTVAEPSETPLGETLG